MDAQAWQSQAQTRGHAAPNHPDRGAIFGYKSHIGIDRRHGLIRRWTVTDAAQHDSRSFAALLDPGNTASGVWADTAYRTKRNLELLERRGLSERIQFRRPPRRQLSESQAKASASRARIRSGIEHVSPPRSIAWRCSSAPSALPGRR